MVFESVVQNYFGLIWTFYSLKILNEGNELIILGGIRGIYFTRLFTYRTHVAVSIIREFFLLERFILHFIQ